MTDGFPDRVTQLRGRWQSDPSSRVFLQLAEEYRHLGRMKDALEVLETGLREHPGYLSALVAKGRCLLELGEPARAREVLERVVQQDATQMVANKLLVRAYLETGEAERARQRLDLYTLLNDRDPEIDELDRRVAAMSRPPQASDGPRPEEPAERPRMDSSLPPEDDPHPATPPSSSAARTTAPAEDDIFDLAAPPARAAAGPEVFDLPLPPPAAPAPAAASASPPAAFSAVPPAAVISPPPAAAPAPAPAAASPDKAAGGPEPFPELSAPERRSRYLLALDAEGIFALASRVEEPAPAPPAVAAAAPVPAPTVAAAPAPAFQPAPLAAPPAPAPPVLAPAAAALEETVAAVQAGPAAEPGTAATATLGFLYLRQGHLSEAERIFREVVRREPDNRAAGEALAHLGERRRPLDAARLLEGFAGGEAAGKAARKTYLLRSYLRRLKAGPEHVS